ncbi:hypothetical protein [Sulfurospirillum cavolei]|uniref:hypothetical protein n=1 Tax=Sulfurospirillum cavolei TaxID=366522 RepID=UPI001198281F|nr:hypothetical protein [Sulfurospirillum cavolei]
MAVNLFALERCALLTQKVRVAHFKEFGTSFPYQYAIAQLEQESGCRASISNDGVGSQGVAQITYRWWKNVLDKEGITEIASVQGSLRAQAAIMRYLHEQGRPLWVTYQRYNGGDWVLKEIRKAGAENWAKAKAQCTRGDSHFTLKSGKIQTRNNCEINYEYSQNIYTLGRQYGDVQDNSQFRYW